MVALYDAGICASGYYVFFVYLLTVIVLSS